MKILLIKMSSMGDIFHTFPALTDAQQAIPDLQVTWVIEENFVELPYWHPAVKSVIPIALRRWRKNPWKNLKQKVWRKFKKQLTANEYDLVIDAQGLLKSAWVTKYARGIKCGYDRHSTRESAASLFYQRKYAVSKKLHAITRVRTLFANILHYSIEARPATYGLQLPETNIERFELPEQFLVFIPNTTWTTKHWPMNYWEQLIESFACSDLTIAIPAGSREEAERVYPFAEKYPHVQILEHCSLTQLAFILQSAQAIVSVDTGLSHLAAALEKPTITLYGATDPKKVGTQGKHQTHLTAAFPCSPCNKKKCSYKETSDIFPACYSTLTPETVITKLKEILEYPT